MTVLANYDVLAHLDAAEPAGLGTLARIAEPVSAAPGPVESFKLTRRSVYAALEGGLGPSELAAFLTGNSRTGLPENVAHSLADWSRKRETLVLREWRQRDYRSGTSLPARWEAGEDGSIRAGAGGDMVSLARLRRFARPDAGGWRLDEASLSAAAAKGVGADQVLGWLREHSARPAPLLLEAAVRNRLGRPARVFAGSLLMLQVPDPLAREAIASAERFKPLLAGAVEPDWFIVDGSRLDELDRLLSELGFARAPAPVLASRPAAAGEPQAGERR